MTDSHPLDSGALVGRIPTRPTSTNKRVLMKKKTKTNNIYPIRFSTDELKAIAIIKRYFDMESLSETVRWSVRAQAEDVKEFIKDKRDREKES